MIVITVPFAALKGIAEDFSDAWLRISREVGNELRKTIPPLIQSMLGPYSTGKLSSGVKVYISAGEIDVRIEPQYDPISKKEYTQYVFKGSKTTTITPVKKKALAWIRWGIPFGPFAKTKRPGQAARTDIIERVKQVVKETALRIIPIVLHDMATRRGGF